MKKFNHICINYTKYNIYTCISINATSGRLRDIRNILYLNTTYIEYFIRIHFISLTQILKRIDLLYICYCMTNCCDIIYNIVFYICDEEPTRVP